MANFNFKKNITNEQGLIISAFVAVFAMLLVFFLIPRDYKNSIPTTSTVTAKQPYCRDLIDDPEAPVVEAPGYTTTDVQLETTKKYRLIKTNVLMDYKLYDNHEGHHFFGNYKEPYTDTDGNHFVKRLPNGDQGHSYSLPSEVGTGTMTFAQYGLLYLVHADNNFIPTRAGVIQMNQGPKELMAVDIYKAIDLPPLPEWVLKCYDQGTGGKTDEIVFKANGVSIPAQEKSPNNQQLQLEWFVFNDKTVLLQAWWTPHCKPAVYLYPTQEETVNVKVYPKGELSYTDPVYDPQNGWTVEADPKGTLKMVNQLISGSVYQYDYLYYESKLLDGAIQKPQTGWVVGYSELNSFYQVTLPKLGLNQKEKQDFENYWLKKLPYSPYYFVGLVDKSQRDYLEPLEVTPKPDTSIRFSFYFEPLLSPIKVTEPQIVTPQRKGFTLVDWGGMIKLHPGTPFTCSQ